MRRTTRLQRVAIKQKPRKNTGPAPVTKNAVWERAGYACERCGVFLNAHSSYSVHHRHPRGMGGTKLSWINDQSNLALLCGSGTTGCHGYIESHRTESYENGWLLRPYGLPWETPIWVHSQHPLAIASDVLAVVFPRGDGDDD